jgi:hypothetical protein
VDSGTFKNDFAEGQLGTKERTDFEASDDAVGVGERKVGSGLPAMHGDVANFDLEAKGDGVDAGNLGPASGDALNLGNQTAADQRLERVCVDVDEQAKTTEECRSDQEDSNLPPSAGCGFGGGFVH